MRCQVPPITKTGRENRKDDFGGSSCHGGNGGKEGGRTREAARKEFRKT